MDSTTAVERGLAQLGAEQDNRRTWGLSGHSNVLHSMRKAIGRVKHRLTATRDGPELNELAELLATAARRSVAADLVAADLVAADLVAAERPATDLPAGRHARGRPPAEAHDHRLAVVVGDPAARRGSTGGRIASTRSAIMIHRPSRAHR
jgi:hypothetical protein